MCFYPSNFKFMMILYIVLLNLYFYVLIFTLFIFSNCCIAMFELFLYFILIELLYCYALRMYRKFRALKKIKSLMTFNLMHSNINLYSLRLTFFFLYFILRYPKILSCF